MCEVWLFIGALVLMQEPVKDAGLGEGASVCPRSPTGGFGVFPPSDGPGRNLGRLVRGSPARGNPKY